MSPPRDAKIDIGAREALCRLRFDVEQNRVEQSGCGNKKALLPLQLLGLRDTDPVPLAPLPQSIRIASMPLGLATPALDEMPASGTGPAHVQHVAGVVAPGASGDGLGFGDFALCHTCVLLAMARQ